MAKLVPGFVLVVVEKLHRSWPNSILPYQLHATKQELKLTLLSLLAEFVRVFDQTEDKLLSSSLNVHALQLRILKFVYVDEIRVEFNAPVFAQQCCYVVPLLSFVVELRRGSKLKNRRQ